MPFTQDTRVAQDALKRTLSDQVDFIAAQILDRKQEVKEAGLLGGKAGIALLFAYLAKAFPAKDYLQHTLDYLDELSNALANEELNYSMSSGVAGIAFVFQHLRNIGLLDPDEDLNLSELDAFIASGAEVDFKSGNWDPLHGLTGLGIYFLERHTETGDPKYLEKIVDNLALMRTETGDAKVWITPGYEKVSNDNYNFGTAHGMPGVLAFLAQVYSRGIRQQVIPEMMTSAFRFLLPYELTDDTYCFPTAVEVAEQKKQDAPFSRLGWCYGDLCMAFALLHCGLALENTAWQTKGIDIAIKTTRRTFENSGCNDAPFCHGTFGLVHLYQRLYGRTGNAVFNAAAEKWLEITRREFYKPGEGAGGYYFRTFQEDANIFEMIPHYSLLEGSAGIGLVQLSLVTDLKPDWDIIFLSNV